MRSIKGFVLSLVFSLATVAAAGSVTAGAAAYLKGDVDNSGIIDYIDVSLVNSYISRDITLGGSITGAGSQVWLADFDGSGKYDGCYAIADPYKKVLYDVYGNLVCNDINSGVTVIKKQDMARSINGVSGS